MNCPTCKIGLIIWTPANPPAPAHYRCLNEACRKVFKNEAIKELRKQEETERRPTMETTEPNVKLEKKCSGKCGKTYPNNESHFTKNRANPDGLERICRTCKSERQKKGRIAENYGKAEEAPGVTRKRVHARQGRKPKVNVPILSAIPACVKCNADRAAVAKEICDFILERFAA